MQINIKYIGSYVFGKKLVCGRCKRDHAMPLNERLEREENKIEYVIIMD